MFFFLTNRILVAIHQLFFNSEIKGKIVISFGSRWNILTLNPTLFPAPELKVQLHFTTDFYMAALWLHPELEHLRVSTYYWSLNEKLMENLAAESLHGVSYMGKSLEKD